MKIDLTIRGEQIIAGGADYVGEFSMEGRYDPAIETVTLFKRYPWHTVEYRGKWDGTLVFGEWVIAEDGFSGRGEFEMWPDDEEMSLEEFRQSDSMAREMVVAGRTRL